MEKFLSIPVTGEGNQLVPVTDVKLIKVGSSPATTTTINYGSGKVITITHGTVGASSITNSQTQFRNWLQLQMANALSTAWTRASYSAIPIPAYAVSGIVIV
jgi:hypothetical protein